MKNTPAPAPARASRRFSLGLAGLALAAALPAQSVFIDFNSPTSITDNLTQATVNTGGTSSGYGTLSYSSSAGLNGAGAAATPVKFSDNYGYASKTALNGGASSFAVSTYFYLGASWETGTSLVLSLGLTSAATPLVGSGNDSATPPTNYGTVGIPTSAQSSIITSLRFSGSAAAPAANFVSYSNAANASSTSTSASLTLGNWYYVETIFTPTSGTTFSVSSSLYLATSSGSISGTALVTHSATITNTTLLASSDLYGYVGSQNGNRRGVTALDSLSFTAVPEPGAYAAFAGVAGLALAFFRRSRRS